MKSFRYAARGLVVLFSTQRNAKLHAAATVVVVCAGAWLRVSTLEWCVLLLACGLVLAAEALNTAVEFTCDALHPDHHPLIGKAKDAAAGGVLLSALAAAAVGLVVFGTRLS